MYNNLVLAFFISADDGTLIGTELTFFIIRPRESTKFVCKTVFKP